MIETPKRYQEFLTKMGGLNPHGEPAFILHWGSSPVKRLAVPDAFLAPYLNCWVLAEWTAPEEFGSPEELAMLGIDFPRRGAYIPLQIYKNGAEPARLDSEQLNLDVLRLALHVVMTHKFDSLSKRYHYLKDIHLKAKADEVKRLAEALEDAKPAIGDAGSFHGQRNCNSVVKQKMEILEKNLSRIINSAMRFPRGGIVQG